MSWTPFVGMFIATISRGRTLREFVTVVILVPSVVCVVWFGIVGGTTMWMEMQGAGISQAGSAEPQLPVVTSEDVRRTLEPGEIQQPGPPRPDATASGDRSLVVGEEPEAPRER